MACPLSASSTHQPSQAPLLNNLQDPFRRQWKWKSIYSPLNNLMFLEHAVFCVIQGGRYVASAYQRAKTGKFDDETLPLHLSKVQRAAFNSLVGSPDHSMGKPLSGRSRSRRPSGDRRRSIYNRFKLTSAVSRFVIALNLPDLPART